MGLFSAKHEWNLKGPALNSSGLFLYLSLVWDYSVSLFFGPPIVGSLFLIIIYDQYFSTTTCYPPASEASRGVYVPLTRIGQIGWFAIICFVMSLILSGALST